MRSLPGQKSVFCFIIILGLALRLWGIGFGLPHQFHQDEPIVVNHAMAYGTGDLNPHFFAIPPLTSYLLFLIYGIMFVLGRLGGVWGGPEEFAARFFDDPTWFYLAGRIFIGVLPGLLCVGVTYRFARKFISSSGALYAAAAMSVTFLNVVNSHYIYTDMLLVLFTLLAYEALFSVHEKPVLRNYCLAGLFTGLAAGVKYNGALLAVPYLLTHLAASGAGKGTLRKTILSRNMWAGALTAAVTFLLTNPFMALDFPGFSASVTQQAGAFAYAGWLHHILFSLMEGISFPLVIAGSCGLLLLFFKDRWGKILVSFPVIFYFLLVLKSQTFARYVLLLVPFFAIGGAYILFEYIPGRLRNAGIRRIFIAAAILFLIPTLIKSVKADMLFSSDDTRIISAEWIRENIARGEKIACDSTNFRPVLPQPYSQLALKKKFLDERPDLTAVRSKKLEFEMKAAGGKEEEYPVYFLFDDPDAQGQFLNTLPALPYDIEAIRREGISYIVVNSQFTSRGKKEFLENITDKADIVMDFSPYRDGIFRGSIDSVDATCIPVMGKDLFSRKIMGPGLRVYRVKE
ncbi:MAG: glycosyltransferase family 39 protein [Candidatus Omnitrophota bacterium]